MLDAGAADHERGAGRDRVPADRIGQRDLTGRRQGLWQPEAGLEPLAVGVDQADERDRRVQQRAAKPTTRSNVALGPVSSSTRRRNAARRPGSATTAPTSLTATTTRRRPV